MDKNSAENTLKPFLTAWHKTEEPLHTTGNMDTTGTDIEQANILEIQGQFASGRPKPCSWIHSKALQLNSFWTQRLSHIRLPSKNIHLHHTLWSVISEDDGSHTAFNDEEVVPWFSDVCRISNYTSIYKKQHEIDGMEIFYAAPFNHERKEKALSSITLNKTKELLLCEIWIFLIIF